MNFELTREYIDELKKAIEEQDEVTAFNYTKELHPADIAVVYRSLTIEEAKYLYLLLDNEKAADVLIELEEDDREKFLKVLPGEVIARQFIDNMESDDAADILAELPEEKKEEVLAHIDDVEQAGTIVDLMSYPEDTAGGLMGTELITVNENWNVLTSLKEMRKQAEAVDEVYYVYVVDDGGILKGTLSLKKLLLVHSSTKIKNIANTDVIFVKTSTPDEEVANIMQKYDLVTLPVVDTIGRLKGRITIDDVVDVMREEADKDFQMVSGITEDIEPHDNVWLLTRARLPWLLIGLVGGVLAAEVIANYEDSLRIYPEMAFFIPLITAMGGNVGVQSSSIVVQALANNTFSMESTFQKVLKEFSVAIINGISLSALILGYNLLMSDSLALTLTVSSALFSVVLFASIFGTFIPLLLNRLKIDPALATGPFITTINDIAGLAIYLVVGRILYTVF